MDLECNFKKYGFEKPDFECEILKKVGNVFFGIVYDEYFGRFRMCEWNVNGDAIYDYKLDKKYFNLTPIKKPWYEVKSNFPCLIVNNNGKICKANSYNSKNRSIHYDGAYEFVGGVRLATKEEALQLVLKES